MKLARLNIEACSDRRPHEGTTWHTAVAIRCDCDWDPERQAWRAYDELGNEVWDEFAHRAVLRCMAIRLGCPMPQDVARVAADALGPTRSFPEGAPQRESYDTDEAHDDACQLYASEKSALRNEAVQLGATVEVHHGCGGVVRLVNERWACSKCSRTCTVDEVDRVSVDMVRDGEVIQLPSYTPYIKLARRGIDPATVAAAVEAKPKRGRKRPT